MKILSPAGSFKSGLAAIDAGADAIYLGMRDISHQRSRCSNFSRKELAKLKKLASLKNIEINVTFNSSYNQKNFDSISDNLSFLESISIDAVIVSDLGLVNLINKNYPKLKIVFSVQGQCGNTDFADIIKKYGVSKLVLDRNISIKEAKDIKEKTGLEVEMFAFGFQCYSQDSICYMGDYFANEPCNVQCSQKVKFLDTESKHRFFFMKYQSCLNFIPEMIESGIDYIKIEGRQRSSKYVFEITKIFREAINSYKLNPKSYAVNPRWMKKLKSQSYGFEITDGFYVENKYTREIISNPSLENIFLYSKDIALSFFDTGNINKIRKEFQNAIKIQLSSPDKEKKHSFSDIK